MLKVKHHIIDHPKNGRLIVTDERLTFELNGMDYTVPAGFVSDGMSVPRFMWGVLAVPDDDVVLAPSVMHDWLYTPVFVCSRLKADWFYVRRLRMNGYPIWKCILTFVGVRLFGMLHHGR